jgi:hypothetical protein
MIGDIMIESVNHGVEYHGNRLDTPAFSQAFGLNKNRIPSHRRAAAINQPADQE